VAALALAGTSTTDNMTFSPQKTRVEMPPLISRRTLPATTEVVFLRPY
jgi:hypothetical protein